MSFIIRNIAGAPVEIDDIGIRLEIGEDFSLAEEASKDIAVSKDLITAIQTSEIIVLDPLDGTTPLTVPQSVEAVEVANDSHFRIRGGELAQLDDVSAVIPPDGYVLTYNQIAQLWEPQIGGTGTPTPTCFPFFTELGIQDDILVTAGSFPFFVDDGSPDNIQIEFCGTGGSGSSGAFLELDGTSTMTGAFDTNIGTLNSNVVDGASAVGFSLNTTNLLTTDGSRSFEIQNNGNDILFNERFGGVSYTVIPDRMILGEAAGSEDRLIDAKITVSPPIFVSRPGMQFEVAVNTPNALTMPVAILGKSTVEVAGFGAIPTSFQAVVENSQDVNTLLSAIGVEATFRNNSNSVAVVNNLGFLNSPSRQRQLPNTHNIAFVSSTHRTMPAGQEAVEGGFNCALYASEQIFADNCYSVVATGDNENNAIGFGGTGSMTITSSPSNDVHAKVYYDGNLMLLTDFASQGYTGVVGSITVGNDTSLGPEEVTNSTFASSTGWVLAGAWSIVGGQLISTGQLNQTATQTLSLTEGKMYKLEYVVQGNNYAAPDGNSPLITISGSEFPRKFIAGTYFHYFVATTSSLLTVNSLSGVESVQYDSISIKECLGGDLRIGGNAVLGTANSLVGFYGTPPVSQPSALTLPDTNIPNTSDATSNSIISNLQTRLVELESKLQSLGIIA